MTLTCMQTMETDCDQTKDKYRTSDSLQDENGQTLFNNQRCLICAAAVGNPHITHTQQIEHHLITKRCL